jgi:hypothetical protein
MEAIPMTREERRKYMPPVRTPYQRYRAWVDDGGLTNVASLFAMAVVSTLAGGLSIGFVVTTLVNRQQAEIVTVHVIDHHKGAIQ